MTRRCEWLMTLCVVTVISTACLPQNTAGQDRSDTVWLEPAPTRGAMRSWYPGSVSKVSGRITAFDARVIKIRVGDEPSERTLAADRVIWIDRGGASENESAVEKELQAWQHPESAQAFVRFLRAERTPLWHRNWLLMRVASAVRTASPETAMELVGRLDAPSPPLVLAALPIAWTRSDRELTEPEVLRAVGENRSAEARLVQISWSLRAWGRERAFAAIDVLTTDPSRPFIAKLAETLRWRLATPPEVVQNADAWLSHLDSMPMVLQVGPTLTLIEKFEAAGLARRASRLRWSLKLTPPFPHPDLPRD